VNRRVDSIRKSLGLGRWRFALAVLLVCLTGGLAWARARGERVDNFRLIDHRGRSHELYYHTDAKAILLVAYGSGCPRLSEAVSALARLTQAGDPGVRVFWIDSESEPDSAGGARRERIGELAGELEISAPILIDETQLIGEALGVRAVGDVWIVDPSRWTLAFRASLIGDGEAEGAEKVRSALTALLAGQPAPPARVIPEGAAACPIALPTRARGGAQPISYAQTIAPMLIDKCVSCHREGGIGPWQMRNYETVLGFSPMIREVVRTQRMPPWHADPHSLAMRNDRSLSREQTRTLVHWIEAGAPRGEGPDPLAELYDHRRERIENPLELPGDKSQPPADWPEWRLGPPDLVVEIPAFEVPASGVLDYRYVSVENPLARDVWIRAVDFLPGDRTVLHHVIASTRVRPEQRTGREQRAGFGRGRESSLSNYVPGAEPLVIPSEAGILVKRDAEFYFQMHYTTSGKAATDTTRLGLYFRKEPPAYEYRSAVLLNPFLRIPAGARDHAEKASFRFKKDALLYSLHPHAHFRGSAARFVAFYPDGSEKLLLNVPRYDFNWQSTYFLQQPEVLPAGTRVEYMGWFDNSKENRANPDPSRDVRWGQQTWDEMLYGVLRYRDLDEPAAQSHKGSDE